MTFKYSSNIHFVFGEFVLRMAQLETQLSLRQLRYFACVFEQHSFTNAAGLLHVSQPSLSRQVAQLEATLGERLLQRGKEGVSATAAGLRLYDLARSVLERVNGAQAEVRGLDRQPQGRVSMTLPTTAGTDFIAKVIKTCRRELPQVDLHVIDGIGSHMGHVLESGMVDFGIVPNADELTGISSEVVYRERLFLVRGPEDPQSNAQRISMATLAKVPLVLGPRSMHLRRFIEAAARAQRLTLTVVFEQQTIGTIAGFVRAGLAATVSNWTVYEEYFQSCGATAQSIVNPELFREISIAFPTARPLNHAASVTFQLVRRLLLERQADELWRVKALTST